MEYHDPSGVFPLVSQDIASRLPLRNLNWHSPPRPLRQIKSLHLEFVPDQQTQASARPVVAHTDSDGPQSSVDIVRSGAITSRERRHQIPGFRTSPYLKLYVLRCDDKDTYKETDRKKLREWVKEIAQSEGKLDHDAFEWLILHVVVPDTLAASEPRWRESSKDPDDLKERKGSNKLIGKSTRTVFDRLRADFHDSGKSSVDRIAQIRIVKQDAVADLLPTPVVAQTYEETAQERENAWNDLVSKLKSLILGPFDRRVRQYEADIAEQEERRSLPGWNFCTFFVHKEGLAIALESVGLVEDALAIYDELSLGLEVVLREIATGQARGTATTFPDFTDDVQTRIFGPVDTQLNGGSDEPKNEKYDAQLLFSKDYRERILRSNISIFDFMCYIFYRQKALVLRLANARSARLEHTSKEGGEDLVLTAEVCWRASNFIHVAARALRQDQSSGQIPQLEVEALVCSWTWAIAGQVLAETAAPALLDLTNQGLQNLKQLPNGTSKRPATSTGIGANKHPQRTSSLPDAQAAIDLARPATRGHTANGTFPAGTGGGADYLLHGGLPGQADLATYRADLIMMRRRMLEQLARIHGWYAGSAFAKHARTSQLQAIQTDGTLESNNNIESVPQPSLLDNCLGPSLRPALADVRSFETAYEKLTQAAANHFSTATQQNFAERLLGDLAMLKCQQGDWRTAATYFERVATRETYAGWNRMDAERLSTYAYCLKRLERKQDFVRTTLALLAKISRRRRLQRASCVLNGISRPDSDDLDSTGLFREAAGVADGLESEEVQPLKDFFSGVELGRIISHHDQTDAIQLPLGLDHVLDDDLEFDQARVRLVSIHDPLQEVWLENNARVVLKPGANMIALEAKTTAYGPYLVDTVMLKAGRLCFVEHLREPPEPTPLGITLIEPTTTIRDSSKSPAFVFLYPRAEAFKASIRRARFTHIDKPRRLEVIVNSGQNEVSSINVRIKPKTAGLRLHLGDAALENIAFDPTAIATPGQLALEGLALGAEAKVVIPYTTEQPSREITFQLELKYTTLEGTFACQLPGKIANELPLDIDVNDIFQLDNLYSSFTVRTTTGIPFAILSAELRSSPTFAVEAPPSLPLPLTVFDAQPAQLLYTITRRRQSDHNSVKRDAALTLGVDYEPMDEVLLSCLEHEIVSDLQKSSFAKYARLLVPLLLERTRQRIEHADLELATLLQESRVPDFDAVGWGELLATLAPEVREPLGTWLHEWHARHTVLSLARPRGADPHCIAISVDVPNVDIVFSTATELPDAEPQVRGPRVFTLGQPVSAHVRVRHTSGWSAKNVFPSVPTFKIHGEDEETTYVISVDSENDAWLVGGHKRRHFVPHDGTDHTFSIVLIPLRIGLQPLPVVDVRQEELKLESEEAEKKPTLTTFQSHYEGAGELVHVIRDVQSATVHIPDSPPPVRLSSSSRPGTSGTP